VAHGGFPVFTGAWQRVLATALASAMVAVGAACGSAGLTASTSTSPAVNPLAMLSADQIVTRAIANLRTADTVHVTGTFTDSGQRVRLKLALVHRRGCNGGMSIRSEGSFRLIMIGTALWFKPDGLFWKSHGANPAMRQAMFGKWVRVPADSSEVSDLSHLCTPGRLAEIFGSPTDAARGKRTNIAGEPALQLTGTGTDSSSAIYVSVSASPQILRIAGTGAHADDFELTGYGSAVRLAMPPPSQTLDGAKYGF
jgi:hypothetical protein